LALEKFSFNIFYNTIKYYEMLHTRVAIDKIRFLLSPSGNGRKTLAFSPQNGIFAWLRPAKRDDRQAQRRNNASQKLCASVPLTLKLSALADSS